jgi:hypothetical protein
MMGAVLAPIVSALPEAGHGAAAGRGSAITFSTFSETIQDAAAPLSSPLLLAREDVVFL